MKKKKYEKEDNLIARAYRKPKYRGKEVVTVNNEIHLLSTKNKEARVKLLTSLVKKYPGSTPMITLIPKENTLILIF